MGSNLLAKEPEGGYVIQGTTETKHFEINYEQAHNNNYSPTTWIVKMANYLEAAWAYQTPLYGTPPGTDNNKIKVDVWALEKEGDKYYGQTSWGAPLKWNSEIITNQKILTIPAKKD